MGYFDRLSESDDRFPALGIVGAFCTGIGYLLLSVGAICFLFGGFGLLIGLSAQYLQLSARPLGGFAGIWSLSLSFGILAAGLQALVVGKLIGLGIQIEKNTWHCARLLERMDARQAPQKEPEDLFFHS